jgi:hypothetical protein
VLEHAAATLVDEGALRDPHVVRGRQRVVPMEVVAALAAAAAVLGIVIRDGGAGGGENRWIGATLGGRVGRGGVAWRLRESGGHRERWWRWVRWSEATTEPYEGEGERGDDRFL